MDAGHGSVHEADLRGHMPLISMSGWNVARIDIAVPVS
jgi:hypothetical protein